MKKFAALLLACVLALLPVVAAGEGPTFRMGCFNLQLPEGWWGEINENDFLFAAKGGHYMGASSENLREAGMFEDIYSRYSGADASEKVAREVYGLYVEFGSQDNIRDIRLVEGPNGIWAMQYIEDNTERGSIGNMDVFWGEEQLIVLATDYSDAEFFKFIDELLFGISIDGVEASSIRDDANSDSGVKGR